MGPRPTGSSEAGSSWLCPSRMSVLLKLGPPGEEGDHLDAAGERAVVVNGLVAGEVKCAGVPVPPVHA